MVRATRYLFSFVFTCVLIISCQTYIASADEVHWKDPHMSWKVSVASGPVTA